MDASGRSPGVDQCQCSDTACNCGRIGTQRLRLHTRWEGEWEARGKRSRGGKGAGEQGRPLGEGGGLGRALVMIVKGRLVHGC